MSSFTRINMPVMIAAAICSSSVLIAVVSWGRSDAVRGAIVQQHEARLDSLETERRSESQAVTILKEDVKHILKAVDEIRTEVKGRP